jgi:DNA-binding transcriptional LysR family regulator
MNTDDLTIFIRVAELGNMSEAAREQGLTPQAISIAVSRLEEKLNTRLFERSTRSIRLSEAGERLLPFALNIVQELDFAVQTLQTEQDSLEGSLHIGMPADFSQQTFLNLAKAFKARYNNVTISMYVSDSIQNFQDQPLDLIFRYGQPKDSALYAKKLLDVRRVLVASPDYIDQHGSPSSLNDLHQHACLAIQRQDRMYVNWQFNNLGYHQGNKLSLKTDLPPNWSQVVEIKPVYFANDGSIIRKLALRGEGITYKSNLDCERDIQAGKLVQVLPTIPGEDASLYVLYSDRKHQLERVRKFLTFSTDYFSHFSDDT